MKRRRIAIDQLQEIRPKQSAERRESLSRFETKALTASDRLVVPGERIGPLRLDGSINDFVQLFGPGVIVFEGGPGKPDVFSLETWVAIGLWVRFDSMTGNVVWISVDTSGPNIWANYSTVDGIHLGSTRKELISVMGPPERTIVAEGYTSYYYNRRGIRFTMHNSGPLAEKVGAMRIVWPSVPRGDTVIIPGVRISSLVVGMTVDQALAVLGGGYHKGESAPGLHVYYWPHLGLSFVAQVGRVTSVRAGSQLLADAYGIRYSTMNDLGRDSTAEQVMEVFGVPPETDGSLFFGGGQWWIYRSLGIAFELDYERKVRLIDVFSPETQ